MVTYPNTELRGVENGQLFDMIRRLEYGVNHLKLNEWVQAYTDVLYVLESLQVLKQRAPKVVEREQES